MNSVKFGQRSGRFKEVENNMIDKLIEFGFVNIYPNVKRLRVNQLLEDLEKELNVGIGVEEIEIATKKFDTRLQSFVIEPEIIGYKIFVMRCTRCKKLMYKKEYQNAVDFGQLPYCSQYCFEVDNGTPMPVSQGALTFDRIFNQPETK